METIIVSVETQNALEAHLGYWLRRVSNHVSGAFARALQEKQTSVAEWVVLSQVHESSQVRPAELANTLGLTRGAISKILDKLEERKWITRKTLQTDRRGQQLLVTPRGRRIVPILTKVADRNDGWFFDCLDAQEKAALDHLLRKLTDFHQLRDIPIE